MSILINRMFSVPCSETKLNLNIKKIKKYCYDLKKTDSGRNVSNRDGWQSTQLFFPNPLSSLADEICEVGSFILILFFQVFFMCKHQKIVATLYYATLVVIQKMSGKMNFGINLVLRQRR